MKVTYDMKRYLMNVVEAYQKVCQTATGKNATLKRVATPVVEEDQLAARSKAPCASGPCIRCEWCGHTFPDNERCKYASYTDVKRERQLKINVGRVSAADEVSDVNAKVCGVSAADEAPEDKGMLHEAACSVLMKILYAARMARPDLQRPTVRLTSYVTKWNSFRDKQLHGLICYIWSTLNFMQEGHIACTTPRP